MENRRKHPRYKESIIITYQPSDESPGATEHSCWLLGISLGGALIESLESLAVGTIIRLNVPIKRGGADDAYIAIEGEVRWQKRITDESPYNMGIEFRHFDAEEQSILEEYIQTFLAPAAK